MAEETNKVTSKTTRRKAATKKQEPKTDEYEMWPGAASAEPGKTYKTHTGALIKNG